MGQVLVETPGGMKDAASPLVVDGIAVDRAEDGRVFLFGVEAGWKCKTRMQHGAVVDVGEVNVFRGDPMIIVELRQGECVICSVE